MLESKFAKSVINFYMKSFDGNPLKVLQLIIFLIIVSVTLPAQIDELPRIKELYDYLELLFLGIGLPYMLIYRPMMIISGIKWLIEMSFTIAGFIIDAVNS